MVRALRVVTVERGVDPRDYALLPFGGAGPMHAAAIAEELGIERIVCPRASGVLSALGLLASERRRDTARTVMLSGRSLTAQRIAAEVDALRRGLESGIAEHRVEVSYELRYRGQGFELAVEASPGPEPSELAELFATEHERRYGYRDPEAEVELVTIRVAVIEPGPKPRPRATSGAELRARNPTSALRRRMGRRRGPARRTACRHTGSRALHLRAAGVDSGAAAELVGRASTRRGRSSPRGETQR